MLAILAHCWRHAPRNITKHHILLLLLQMMMPWDPATMPDSIREQRGGEGWVTREGFLAAVTRGQKVEVGSPGLLSDDC
jgi:hypothetical protein